MKTIKVFIQKKLLKLEYMQFSYTIYNHSRYLVITLLRKSVYLRLHKIWDISNKNF